MHAATDSLAGRVEAGAAWLDAVYPEWWTHIDLDELDLADSCRCVCGQLFGRLGADGGGFGFILEARDKAGLPIEWTGLHGFVTGTDAAYRRLDELWIDAVKARADLGAL
jgi:hypothetical protein